jgi:hypothetical protein
VNPRVALYVELMKLAWGTAVAAAGAIITLAIAQKGEATS